MRTRRSLVGVLVVALAIMAAGPVQAQEEVIDFDLREWSQEGIADWGSWNVSDDGSEVIQEINDSPTFFVSPESFASATISGVFEVQTSGDDDYIGFVFGYRGPRAPDTTGYDLFAFNWKQSGQSFGGCTAEEGMSVLRVDGQEDPAANYTPSGTAHPAFWCHSQDEADARGYDLDVDVLDTNWGEGTGWEDNTEYEFTLEYRPTNVRISIDGVEVFDIDRSFPPGAFGFYNYSQSDVRYSGFSVEEEEADRIVGLDRYETAVELSRDTFESAVDTVYVATGATYPDALSGGVPAALDEAPLLLVRPSSVPAVTRAEIERLDPQRIVIFGGTAAVGASVESDLATLADDVERWSGADRYATAAEVAAESFPDSAAVDRVYLASGENFPDALAGVPAGTVDRAPILLTRQDALPAATSTELDRLDPEEVVILGGSVAVSEALEDALADDATVLRRAGGTRFTTAVDISEQTFDADVETVFISTGAIFADALATGAVAGAAPGPILLVTRDQVASEVLDEVARLQPERIVVLGGTGAVSEDVAQQLRDEVN